jgi:hypothetical protein
MPSSLTSSHNIRLGEAEQSRTALKASSQAYRPSVFAANDGSSVAVSSASTALSSTSQAFCPSTFTASTQVNDTPLVQVVPASQYPSVYPAAKGALQCCCRGEVEKMLEHYGWILLYGAVNHPLAGKRGGRIYISKDDVLPGKTLQVGDIVTFYLYADEMGLGAEVCDVEQPASARFCGQASLHNGISQDWSQVPWQQTSHAQAYYYVPVAIAQMPSAQQQCSMVPAAPVQMPGTQQLVMSSSADQEGLTKPERLPDETTGVDAAGSSEAHETELPSLGSAGHFDGTCKRCAFFPKGRCKNGADCSHCHFDHVPRPRLKSQRKRNSSPPTHSDQTGTDDRDESVDPFAAGDSDADDVSLTGNESLASKPLSVASTSAKDGEEFVETESEVPKENDCTKDTGSVRTAGKTGHARNEVETRSELNLLDLAKGEQPLPSPSCSRGDDAETLTPSTAAPSDDDETRSMSIASSVKSPASSKGRSRGAEARKEPSKRVEISPREDVCRLRKGSTLAPSPTSWSEQQRIRRLSVSSTEGGQSSEKVARMARSLLNKLTKAKFESLSSQILELPFSTPEQLSAVAAEIFEKATTQDGFRSLYVDLCMRLNTHLAQLSSSVSDKDFRKALANACQAIFDRSLQPGDTSKYDGMSEEERFELEVKVKTQRLGTMRFIGELLVKRLLAQKLMVPIMFELLAGDEAALESLIALLTVVAPEFDQKPSPYQAPLHDTFSTLSRKTKDKSLSSRLRFQLRDLFDARAKGWALSPTP